MHTYVQYYITMVQLQLTTENAIATVYYKDGFSLFLPKKLPFFAFMVSC